MEFSTRKIIGRHAASRRAVSLVPWMNSSLAYIACVGSGAVLIPLGNSTRLNDEQKGEPDDEQIFYCQSPSSQSLASTGSPHSSPDSSPTSGSRLLRVNKSSCADASSVSRLAAVGECGGYMPRLLLYDLVSGLCLDVVRDQHQFGVQFVKFSPSGKFLASLGTPQDGYIYVWDTQSGSLSLRASNRCISEVNDLVWINDTQLITVGVRHVKVWNVESDTILNGRNVILGPIADQTFECAMPISENGKTSFFVGTARGAVYKMPENELVCETPDEKAVKSISVSASAQESAPDSARESGASNAQPVLLISTLNHIYEYKDIFSDTARTPSRVYNFGSPILLSYKEETFFAATERDVSSLLRLADMDEKGSAIVEKFRSDQIAEFIRKKGVHLRARGESPESAICWNSEDAKLLIWPSELVDVQLSDITVADMFNGHGDGEPRRHIVAGSLSGDVWLDGQVYNAHNGPVTDVQMFDSSLAISSARDRTVQIWARNKANAWTLKQTVLFSTPILKAQLCGTAERMALVCCGANKTVYIYQTAVPINVDDENSAAFSDSPRSVLLKGMPFDLTAFGSQAVVSTNDKTVSIIDPWSENKIAGSWRPIDSNGDSVNLTHIQVLKPADSSLLLGAANNKSVLLFTLDRGEVLASQWGHGDPITGIACANNTLLAASDAFIVSTLRPDQHTSAPVSHDQPPQELPYPQMTPPETSTSTHLDASLPRLHLASSPPRSRSSSPIRKVFDTGNQLRPRGMSPIRSPARPGTSRSPSPPRRSLTRSPTLDRGRAAPDAHASTSGPTSIPKQPNLAYKPLRLSSGRAELPPSTALPPNTALPPSAALPLSTASQQRASTPTSTGTDVTAQLTSALKAFTEQADAPSETRELRALLLSALNKVDELAIFQEFTERLGAQLCERVESRIDHYFKGREPSSQP